MVYLILVAWVVFVVAGSFELRMVSLTMPLIQRWKMAVVAPFVVVAVASVGSLLVHVEMKLVQREVLLL